MSKAMRLNELCKDAPFYMATSDFEVTDEGGNIIAFEHYDILMMVQRKVYVNSVKYYMCKTKEPVRTNIILRTGDAALNHIIEIKFVDMEDTVN